MAFGPIDLIVLEFKDSHFHGKTMANLTDLVSNEIIRILDLVMLVRDERGDVTVQELKELDPLALEVLEPLRAEISGLITVEDIEMIGKKLRDSTTAAIMLFENIWSIRLKQDLFDAGGRLVMHERIPREVVAEAIRDLAEYE
ncbi:MAG TPA: DUF6325 family protein [Anaerolineales bacterium]|nr:DUF6325 family protein [Anaerolineales bacterium]